MYKRFWAFSLIFCLLAGSLAFPSAALADTLKSAPLTAGATQNGMVRVRLSSLGSPATLNLTVLGSYTVNGQTSQAIPSGSSVTVHYNASSGQLSLSYAGKTTAMGSSFRLRRHETSGQNGIKIAQSRAPGNLYPGDLQFTVRNNNGANALYVIAHIYMEDYLYGVLPYEMGNSSGLEALKAQAVASRTYTMRAMNAAASSLYDVVDTTSDQVYSGTPSGNANCLVAVDETRGIVVKNGSALTATYYTASNGGQTESIKNAWGVTNTSYLTVKDDPYDLSNPESRKVSFFVSASGAQKNTVLGSLLNGKAAQTFGAGATVTAVTAVAPHTPRYPAPSRLYTKLDFDVRYTSGGQSGVGTLTFDIFNELEGPLSMSINSGKNELWSVTEAVGGFTVTARRYGHGIGLSQRGAMQMAKMGYTYDQILAFYFEGCTRVQYTLTRSILSPLSSGQDSQEQVIAEPPASITDDPGASVTDPADAVPARVTTLSGSLNLRAQAGTGAKVLRTIPQNETVTVVEKGAQWCKVVYAGQTGYVMARYLTFSSADNTPAVTPAPTVTPTQSETLYARVTTASGSLNLRAQANSSARVLRTIPQYEVIPILEKGAVWCQTAYGGQTGYVMTSFLTFTDGPAPAVTLPPAATPTPAPTAAPVQPDGLYARVSTASGSLNLRAQPTGTARVLRTIPQYALIPILQKGSAWCQTIYAGQTGYVMTSFLTFTDDPVPTVTAAPAVTPAPTAAPTQTQALFARVTTPSGSLNLRALTNSSARMLCTIPQNEVIPVLSQGADWCQVRYNGKTGYVMTRFLTFVSEPAAPDPTPSLAPVTAEYGLQALSAPVSARVASTARTLNLRAGCSLDALILTEIPRDEFVVVTAVGDTWCAVEYEGLSGYCMRKYLELAWHE